MDSASVQALHEFAAAIVAVGCTTAVYELVGSFSAGDIELEELVIEMRALERTVH